VIIIKR